MNHQPFEEWLLAGEELDPAQRNSLAQHLENCQDCPQLARAWQEVHAEIRRAPLATPAPGFSARFADRLEQESIRKQRRITWLVLIIFLLAGLGAGIFLLYQQAGSFPTPFQLVSTMLKTFDELADTSRWVTAVVRILPTPLTLGVWISMATSLLFWTLTWFVLIWRLPNRKGVLNETLA